MKPGKMYKGYYIRDKETLKQWRAPSGKNIWATPGAAKLAYSYRSAYLREDGNDWYGRPVRTNLYGRTEVITFNEQDKFEIVELNSEVSEAILLLQECSEETVIGSDLHSRIVAFLNKVSR